MVDVESLVPPDHLLRKIDAVLDLSFVPDAVAECYAVGRGRPSIDPELALRMMLLGMLYDLGDRELSSVQHPFDHIRALLAHCCHQLALLADTALPGSMAEALQIV